MKTILLIFTVLLSCSAYSQEKKEEKKNKEKQIYICNSMKSKRYHFKKDCKGLEKCTDTIVKVSLKKVKNSYGRTVCGYETHIESSSRSKN